jgi:hypothetical protein
LKAPLAIPPKRHLLFAALLGAVITQIVLSACLVLGPYQFDELGQLEFLVLLALNFIGCSAWTATARHDSWRRTTCRGMLLVPVVMFLNFAFPRLH